MKSFLITAVLFCFVTGFADGQSVKVYTSDAGYLSSLQQLFKAQWPNNRTINIVFHGHSVPAGYFKTPDIKTMESYPELTLQYVSAIYPNAVINAIKTCIGGENAVSGAARFDSTVLNHHPDILFIDYALNDSGIGLEKAKTAWKTMIEKALAKNIKVVLCTPTPDQSENILDTTTALYKHTQQIIQLAAEYKVGLVDSYNAFRKLIADGEDLKRYMSQVNHPDKAGHEVVLREIMKLFPVNY
ncbi:MAG: SGNH/GDSL hydrolase family protein [Chitinophagaceae bacterium]|nr:SGNH/GDSL hydrolase family protein [Chitinophagaceae bacterium]